ncbi:DUF952 domain-containing protein [bacterium]|nr:DUF952 domain-containing protein [bacterium]
MTQTGDAVIYHILSWQDWKKAQRQGDYRPVSLAAEGFIHLSTRAQVPGTLARFFAGHTGLALLCVEVVRLRAELRYDVADGLSFPHLYGPLNLDAVSEVLTIEPGSNDPFSGRSV